MVIRLINNCITKSSELGLRLQPRQIGLDDISIYPKFTKSNLSIVEMHKSRIRLEH